MTSPTSGIPKQTWPIEIKEWHARTWRVLFGCEAESTGLSSGPILERAVAVKWTRNDAAIVAVVWIGLMGFVLLLCVLLPTPPAAIGQPGSSSIMVDFFVAAVAAALAVGVASVLLALWFVRRESRKLERTLAERDDALRRMVEERVKETFDERQGAGDAR